jgi:hypothetical protein
MIISTLSLIAQSEDSLPKLDQLRNPDSDLKTAVEKVNGTSK